jgi:hypothetical protein
MTLLVHWKPLTSLRDGGKRALPLTLQLENGITRLIQNKHFLKKKTCKTDSRHQFYTERRTSESQKGEGGQLL